MVDNRYRILARVGEGGMGTVYSAEHLVLARQAAVKVLRPELCRDPRAVERFIREARAASSIAHPHVVEVFDTGVLPDGQAYYVMEFLQGENLASTLERDGPLPWLRVRAIALQICSALVAVHARGIVHRDLKPENCFRVVREQNPDFIKILDFGIAKIGGPGEDAPQSLTNTGEVLGTTLYMAPEQASGLRIDHRVDIYAIGVIMFQLLTDRLPFTGENTLQVLTAILTRDPPMMCAVAPDADISDEVEALVARAMHRNRNERYQDVASLTADLQALVEQPDARRAPGRPPPVKITANHRTLALAVTEMHTDAALQSAPGLVAMPAAAAVTGLAAPVAGVTAPMPTAPVQGVTTPMPTSALGASGRPASPRKRAAQALLMVVILGCGATLALMLTRHDKDAADAPGASPRSDTWSPAAGSPDPVSVPGVDALRPGPAQPEPPEPIVPGSAQPESTEPRMPGSLAGATPSPKPVAARKPAKSGGQSFIESVIRDRCSAKIQLEREVIRVELKAGQLVELDAVDPRFKGNAFVRCARDAISRSEKIQSNKLSLSKSLEFRR